VSTTTRFTSLTQCSGAGKTQFLLTLLLSVQLPPPRGLSCGALYISTESALHTTRLSQLLRTHSNILTGSSKPNLDSVMSIVTPDLESQDHILRYQVPVAIRQYGVRLIILDSVAANYRAEFDRPGAGTAAGQTNGANMAQRSSELVKLGQWLRDLAREHNVAIVVANQVGDRFSTGGIQHGSGAGRTGNGMQPGITVAPQVNNGVAEGPGPQDSLPFAASTHDPMALDHQQRWFTGWGDDRYPTHSWKSLKTPSLGLIWTTQIACRIALIKRPVYGPGVVADEDSERGEPVLRKWRRWMRVVFAPHAGPAGPGLERAVEFQIRGDGIRSVRGKTEDGDSDGEEADGGGLS
jgi:DNA repair protein RAD57